MGIENIQEFISVWCLERFFLCTVCMPVYKWPKWPDLQTTGQARPGQANVFTIVYFAIFSYFNRHCWKNKTKQKIIIYYIEIQIHKKLNINALNQTVNLTIGTSIVHSLCSLLQYEWKTIKMQLMQLIINTSYGSNVMTVQFLTFSSVAEEAGCCRGVILAVGDAV